jgi:uroporphyrinogen-III synthase
MSAPPVAAVWVTRPQPANARTAGALRAAGHEAIGIPLLEVRLLDAVPPSEPPDWILFVSAGAVDGLKGILPSRPGGDAAVAAIGEETRRRAEAAGWRVVVVGDPENAEGLLRALEPVDLRGRRIWVPSGNRRGSARDRFPDALRSRGALVTTISVYETVDREPSPDDRRVLAGVTPAAVVLHSPSAAEALWKSPAPEVERWRRAPAIAVGAATAARSRALGSPCVLECARPSDEAVLEVLAAGAGGRNPT